MEGWSGLSWERPPGAHAKGEVKARTSMHGPARRGEGHWPVSGRSIGPTEDHSRWLNIGLHCKSAILLG